MLQHKDYTVGWICALPKEQTAAIAMLDERHARLPKPPSDSNTYTLGSIGDHNIVIACLPKGMYGTIPAATVVSNMTRTFPAIRFGLMVGIGGGIPPQVRLGDVVVSVPQGTHPGVIQWDMGKTEQGGQFRRSGALNNPPTSLLTALSSLESDQELGLSEIPSHLEELGTKFPSLKEKYLKSDHLKDVLFDKEYSHQMETSNCENCAKDRMIKRGPEKFTVHYGLIASGNQVIKDAAFRESLVKDIGGEVLCIEMEAAGLMNSFPCIVIRGICDYADSHKNKAWQEHAAAVAAAFTKELLRYVMAEEVAAEKAAKDVLSQINQTVTAISEVTTETQHLLERMEETDILDWISPNYYGSEQSETLKRWLPETCQWFFSSEKYQNWLQARGKTLYCPGIPGAGKTIMSAAVIHNISSHLANHKNVGLAYVYFMFSRQREQTVEHVLASLLMQFLRRQASVPGFVRDTYKHHKKSGTRATREELTDMLSTVILQFERAYIVLDALDECTTENRCRMEILSIMLALQVSASANILATSRENEEIVSMFNHRDTAASILPIWAQDGDVSIFLHRQLETQDADVFDGPIRELVASKVTQVAEGMFLLARLHINTIVEIPTKKKVKIALEGLETGPDGLHTVYEQTMNRIQSQGQGRKDLARLILLWIVHARRPLFVRELRHALGVGPDSAEVDEDDIPSISILKSVCAGLIQVVEQRAKYEKKGQTVGLIHYTAQEYFEKTQAKWFPDAQRYITQTCVAYLSFPSLSGCCDDDEKFIKRLATYPFYSYAAHEWGHHARALSKEPRVVAFLQRREAIEGSIQALEVDLSWWRMPSQNFPKGMNGLHLAAVFGLRDAAQELLDVVDINEIDSHGRTPLVVAMQHRHYHIVELLIKIGNADITVVDGTGKTVLSMATNMRRLDVVELLIKTANVDVNATDGGGTPALIAAAELGYSDMIKLFIETSNVDVDMTNDSGDTALSVAAARGFLDVVELLIKTGAADANTNNENVRTALLAAAKRGRLHVVEWLINYGNADSNVLGEYGRAALAAAAGGGHFIVVEFLLKTKNVDLDAVDRDGRTALWAAIENGRLDMTKFLLNTENVDINRTDFMGRTALSWAADNSQTDVVKLLIKRGDMDINHPNKDGETPLIIAVWKGSLDIVKFLIKVGKAEINSQDKKGRTALICAARNGAALVVSFLLESGADTLIVDTSGHSAIDHASHVVWNPVRKLLMSLSSSRGDDRRVRDVMEQLGVRRRGLLPGRQV